MTNSDYELAKSIDYKKVNCGLYCAGTVLTKDVVAERQGRAKKMKGLLGLVQVVLISKLTVSERKKLLKSVEKNLQEIVDFDEGKSESVKGKEGCVKCGGIAEDNSSFCIFCNPKKEAKTE